MKNPPEAFTNFANSRKVSGSVMHKPFVFLKGLMIGGFIAII